MNIFGIAKIILPSMNSASELSRIVGKNLHFFMQRSRLYTNANALAVKAGVDPQTVRGLLDPKKRAITARKGAGYPQVDTLAKIAHALSCEVWQLLHPNIALAFRQAELYSVATKDIRAEAEALS